MSSLNNDIWLVGTNRGNDTNSEMGAGILFVNLVQSKKRMVALPIKVNGDVTQSKGNKLQAALYGLVYALQFLSKPCNIYLYTDNAAIAACLEPNIVPMGNKELWDMVYASSKKHLLVMPYLIERDSHPYNIKAQKLAEAATRGILVNRYTA